MFNINFSLEKLEINLLRKMLTRNANMEIYMENISPKLFTRREMLHLVILTYNISYTCIIIS